MSGVNKITRSVSRKSLFESAISVISSAISFNQGDFLYLDTSAHLIKKPSSEGNGATFCGVAACTISSGKLASPYTTDVDSSVAISDIPGPVYGVVFKAIAKTGDALAPGALVYLDPATSTRGVTVTGTKAIGVYVGPTVASASAGQEVEILVGARSPALDALVF